MKRWELMKFTNRAGDPDAKMSPAEKGNWVKHEDTLFDPREYVAPDAEALILVYYSDENECWIAQGARRGVDQNCMTHGSTPQEAISQWWIAKAAFESVLQEAPDEPAD